MDTAATRKPHAVCVPFPAQGHIRPVMQLANLLHSRGFHITIVNTEYNHRRFIRSHGRDSVKGLPDFRFEAIPDGLPPSDQDATQDVIALCDSVRKNCLAPFRDLLAKLNSSEEVPEVSCVISDGVMSFAIEAAKEIGVPEVQFWTASACSFMGYLHYRELVKRGIFPFKDEKFHVDGTLDTPIDWIPGMRNIRLRDIPSFIRTTDPNDIMFDFMGEEVQNCLNSSAIIFNTFEAFEHEVLEAIAIKFPAIYTIGPLPLMAGQVKKSGSELMNSSLWKEDLECLQWLDEMEPNSVIYVNYGCITVMSEKDMEEFAWGLANSKHPFIWIIRPDVVKGKWESGSAMLPREFLEEIKGRGIVTSWRPQYEVLEHASVGAFLTHCGWNSMMESVSAGVPVICWPFFADQQTNCKYACEEWGIGVEIDQEVRREEIEAVVREVMGDGEQGKRMRMRSQYWKKEAEAATQMGGSSSDGFERLLKFLH